MIDERAPNSMNMTPSQMEHQPIQDKRVYTVDEIRTSWKSEGHLHTVL